MMSAKIRNRAGKYPTYKVALLATDSKHRTQMDALAGDNDLLSIPLEGGDTAVFTLGDAEVETSEVKNTILDVAKGIIKFWTKSGTYYCFGIKNA